MNIFTEIKLKKFYKSFFLSDNYKMIIRVLIYFSRITIHKNISQKFVIDVFNLILKNY